MKKPVLLLIFNRPHYTQEIFEKIREYKPERLYVAADGPRNTIDGEKELCEKTRSIVNEVDWDCEVKTLFRNENLGCRKAISSAVTWFFENEECGIILEDDCYPNSSFFDFCEELLEKYKDDTRVNHIAGYNPYGHNPDSNSDYYFINFMNCWGWASWRRAWMFYDDSCEKLDDFLKYNINNALQDKYQASQISTCLSLFCNNNHSWDWVYQYSLLKEHSLCIIPSVNLVENLDMKGNSKYIKSCSLSLPLRHPEFVLPDVQYYSKIKRKKEHLVFRYYLKKIIPHKALMIISKILRVFMPTKKLRSFVRKLDEI